LKHAELPGRPVDCPQPKLVFPSDLLEQPMTLDFAVNLKTADAHGITFPQEVIQ
jgi:hypothetical protein